MLLSAYLYHISPHFVFRVEYVEYETIFEYLFSAFILPPEYGLLIVTYSKNLSFLPSEVI